LTQNKKKNALNPQVAIHASVFLPTPSLHSAAQRLHNTTEPVDVDDMCTMLKSGDVLFECGDKKDGKINTIAKSVEMASGGNSGWLPKYLETTKGLYNEPSEEMYQKLKLLFDGAYDKDTQNQMPLNFNL
jgi:hypothetical protein